MAKVLIPLLLSALLSIASTFVRSGVVMVLVSILATGAFIVGVVFARKYLRTL